MKNFRLIHYLLLVILLNGCFLTSDLITTPIFTATSTNDLVDQTKQANDVDMTTNVMPTDDQIMAATEEVYQSPTEIFDPQSDSIEVIISDMQLPHEGKPHGLPTNVDWYNGPRLSMGNNPWNFTAVLAWGHFMKLLKEILLQIPVWRSVISKLIY